MIDQDNRWIQRFGGRPSAAKRVVCFPHAGGAASFFHAFSEGMPSSIETVAVQYPGRQDRWHEQLIDDIAALADQVSEVLLPWADRPLAFFGHSMGATVGFEVARRMQRRGVALVALVVSARRAPSCHREETVHLRDDQGLLREIKELDGTQSEVLDDAELVQMILPAIRNDYRAIETYRYQPGADVSCPITAVIGDADPKVNMPEARAWARHTSGEFELRVLPGDHFYLTRHRSEVINIIRDRILTATSAP